MTLSRGLTLLVLVLLAAAVPASAFLTNDDHHRGTTKIIQHHSLHPPLLRDTFAADGMLHWNFYGAAVVTDDYIRLTADRQSQVGSIWNVEPIDLPQWEVVLGVRIHSKSSYGADGLGFWIVDQIPGADGPLVGHPMKFKGVGIIFDSYDNDRYRDNPAIHVLYNDGSNPDRDYDTQQDFRGQAASTCYFDYRNTVKPNIALLRVRYEGSTLSVYAAKSTGAEEFLCATAHNVELAAASYFFGLTAETGGISDHHDVHFLHAYPLDGATYDHDVYKHQPFSQGADREAKHYWRVKTIDELAEEEREKERVRLAEDEVQKVAREQRAKEAMERRKVQDEKERVEKLEREVNELRKLAAEQAAAHEKLKENRAAQPQLPAEELPLESDESGDDEPEQPSTASPQQQQQQQQQASVPQAPATPPPNQPEAAPQQPAQPAAPAAKPQQKRPGVRPGVRPGQPRRK